MLNSALVYPWRNSLLYFFFRLIQFNGIQWTTVRVMFTSLQTFLHLPLATQKSKSDFDGGRLWFGWCMVLTLRPVRGKRAYRCTLAHMSYDIFGHRATFGPLDGHFANSACSEWDCFWQVQVGSIATKIVFYWTQLFMNYCKTVKNAFCKIALCAIWSWSLPIR